MQTISSGPPAGPGRARSCERGIALIWSLVGMFLITGIVLAGTERMRALDKASSLEFAVEGQARQVAESGLVNALSWLRRQATQPVTVFAPRRDLLADPKIDETDDPAVGLVREYEIGPGLWGRYVVRKGKAAEAFIDANANGLYDRGEKVWDLDGNGKRTMAFGARDISARHGLAATSGGIWRLESEGYVFRRSRADLPLGQGPNAQLATARLATDVRRLTVALPASAGLVVSRASEAKVKKGAWISSPVLGLGYRAGTGSPTLQNGSKVTAPLAHASLPTLLPTGGYMDGTLRRISVQEIFGVSLATLKAMSDMNTGTVRIGKKPNKGSWKKQRLGYTIPYDSLVVFTENRVKKAKIIFDKKFPLRGRGIVIVDGDVEFKKGSNSNFEGILVVLGEAKIDGPAKFKGTVIVTKKTEIKGRRFDTKIEHDPALVTQMINELAKYRRSKASFVPTAALLDESPNESVLSETRPGGLTSDYSPKLGLGEVAK